ncbi:MAG: hypothetical protein L6R28_14735 [Planctomycetes bacterium]|nr:hypothetical protein [Planctomycetota bacterium]
MRGKYLRLLGPHGDEYGWRVEAVYARMAGHFVHARSRDYLRQRSASDI